MVYNHGGRGGRGQQQRPNFPPAQPTGGYGPNDFASQVSGPRPPARPANHGAGIQRGRDQHRNQGRDFNPNINNSRSSSRDSFGNGNNRNNRGLQNEADKKNLLEGADMIQRVATQAQEMARRVMARRLDQDKGDEDEDVTID